MDGSGHTGTPSSQGGSPYWVVKKTRSNAGLPVIKGSQLLICGKREQNENKKQGSCVLLLVCVYERDREEDLVVVRAKSERHSEILR